MNIVQSDYQEYAFINTIGTETVRNEQGGDSIIYTPVDRTHEDGSQWFFIVFAPYNYAYCDDCSWFNTKGIQRVNDKFLRNKNVLDCIITKETDATKVHINALVRSTQDLSLLHQRSYCNKYSMFVSSLSTIIDRQNVLSYILKENKTRTFVKYKDYISWSR